MKIVNCSKNQFEILKYIHPEHNVSSFMALIPASEYFFWNRRFTHLLDGLSAFLYPTNLKTATKLPIIQCVSKLIGINQDGFLIPKVFKFNTLPEGTFKDFGVSSQVVPLLDTITDTIPYPIKRHSHKEFKTNCLGFLAFDSDHPSVSKNPLYLSHFMPCISSARLKNIMILNGKIVYDYKEYASFLPTYNYYENELFQKLLQELHDLKLLVLPKNFQLNNLQTLIGFSDPSWSEVKPLEFFLDESPENLDHYVLIRTDDGKIVTWNEVMSVPKLRLEIEMENYWLWQEACHTSETLESLNLYWEFGMDYPWIIDKRDNTFVPAFIVED